VAPGPEHERTSQHPIVAGIDASDASRAATVAAVELAADLDAPLVFVHVRRPPPSFLGAPGYQRRLTRDMAHARVVLADAVGIARAAGVDADTEMLEGSPQRRLAEFARHREARLLIVGSRRRKLGRGVSRGVVRRAQRPVLVAADNGRSPRPRNGNV
jgi:nucleotide-binding universal stress UspA family protein